MISNRESKSQTCPSSETVKPKAGVMIERVILRSRLVSCIGATLAGSEGRAKVGNYEPGIISAAESVSMKAPQQRAMSLVFARVPRPRW